MFSNVHLFYKKINEEKKIKGDRMVGKKRNGWKGCRYFLDFLKL